MIKITYYTDKTLHPFNDPKQIIWDVKDKAAALNATVNFMSMNLDFAKFIANDVIMLEIVEV